jgi:hypothetical protein
MELEEGAAQVGGAKKPEEANEVKPAEMAEKVSTDMTESQQNEEEPAKPKFEGGRWRSCSGRAVSFSEAKTVSEVTEANPTEEPEEVLGTNVSEATRRQTAKSVDNMFSGLDEARDEILRLRAEIAALNTDEASFAERLQDAKEERAFASQNQTLAMDTQEGFLFKEGSEKWKLRFFVVDRTCVSYFEDDIQTSVPKGVFFLSPTTSVLCGDEQSRLSVKVRPANAQMGAAQMKAIEAAKKESARIAAAPQQRALNTRINQANGTNKSLSRPASAAQLYRPQSAKQMILPPPSGPPPAILPPPSGPPPKVLPSSPSIPAPVSQASQAETTTAMHNLGAILQDEATGQIEEAVGAHIADQVIGGHVGEQLADMFGGELGGYAIKGLGGAVKGIGSMAKMTAKGVGKLGAHAQQLGAKGVRPGCPLNLAPFSFSLVTNGMVLKLACENARELKQWTDMFKQRVAFLQVATRGYLKVDKGKWANVDGRMVQRCVLRGGEWKQFHFLLEPECLHAFKEQSLEKSKGVFAFEQGCTIDTDIFVGGNNKNRIFALVCGKEATYFEADNEEEYQMW